MFDKLSEDGEGWIVVGFAYINCPSNSGVGTLYKIQASSKLVPSYVSILELFGGKPPRSTRSSHNAPEAIPQLCSDSDS